MPFFATPGALTLGVAANVRSGIWPVNFLRHPPEGGSSGWFIWASETLSQDPDFFRPLHAAHLEAWRAGTSRYLGLPPGWRVLLGEEEYEDVWFDEALLRLD